MTTDSHTNRVFEGGCLCAAVRFRYAGPLGGELGAITVCHCSLCRKAQGVASAVAPALLAGYRIERGVEFVEEYESSPGKRRAFCRRCGSPLYSRRDSAPDRLRVRLGSFDDPLPHIRVAAHIFCEGAPAWSRADGAPGFAGEEPGRN